MKDILSPSFFFVFLIVLVWVFFFLHFFVLFGGCFCFSCLWVFLVLFIVIFPMAEGELEYWGQRVGLMISLFYKTFPKIFLFICFYASIVFKFQGPRKTMFYG